MEPWRPGQTMGGVATRNRNAAILAAFVRLKGKNDLLRLGRRPDPQPAVSVHSALDLGAPQQLVLDATSSFPPLGFQKGELSPHFVEHYSCFDEAASLSFRNHRVPVRKGQAASVSHALPGAGSTTPQEHPGEPWRTPDHRDREECLEGSRHTLSHVDRLAASGRANFWKAAQAAVADARSRRRRPRQSPFHWRDGAWPALPETANANRRAASPLF